MIYVIDCSHWQGVFNPSQIKAGGVSGVIHKATEGMTFIDSKFLERRLYSSSAGLLYGSYHFLNSGNATSQADFFLKTVGEDKNTLLALDFEAGSVQDAEEFVKRVYDTVGVWPVLYTRASYIFEQIGNASTILTNCPLWVASYQLSPSLPKQWRSQALWQYTNGVNGINPHFTPGVGNCDRSIFNGTDLESFWKIQSGSTKANVNTKTFSVFADVLNVREAPSTSAPVLAQLDFGAQVEVDFDSLTNTFYRLVLPYPNDWISSKWIAESKPASPPKILDIPYVSQESIGSRKYANDCGPACVRMLRLWKGLPDITTDALSDMTTLMTSDVGLTTTAIALLANETGLSMRAEVNCTLDRIKREIDGGNPVISLFKYSALKSRENQLDTRDHLALVVGYDDSNVYLNDPDWWDSGTHHAEDGHKWRVPYLEFSTAISELSTPYQGVFFYTPPVVSPPPTLNASRMSLHFQPGGNSSLMFDLLKTMRLAGKPVPGMLLMRYGWGGEPTPQDIHGASPETEVILRRWNTHEVQPDWRVPDLYALGVEMVSSYNPPPEDKYAFAHQLINELSYGVGTQSFWNGAMNAANAKGIKIAVGCFATGNPKLPDEDPTWWAGFYTILRRCKAEGHPFLLHQYTTPEGTGPWDEPWQIMRHKKMYSAFPEDLRDLPLRIGEFGDRFLTGKSDGYLVNHMLSAETAIKEDHYLRWMALWTWGGAGSWQSDQIDGHAAAIKAYLLGYHKK